MSSSKIFFSLIAIPFADFLLKNKYLETITLLIPFAISMLYKKAYTLRILLLLCFMANFTFLSKKNVLIMLAMLVLDILVENFPKKLERIKVLNYASIAYAIVFPFLKQEDFSQILSATQVLIGSFQAIRVFEKRMKRYRTDLGGIYYKAQVIIFVLSFFSFENDFNFTQKFFGLFILRITYEAILLIKILFGVFLRPNLENMKTAKKHGILMRISYSMILIRYFYMMH